MELSSGSVGNKETEKKRAFAQCNYWGLDKDGMLAYCCPTKTTTDAVVAKMKAGGGRDQKKKILKQAVLGPQFKIWVRHHALAMLFVFRHSSILFLDVDVCIQFLTTRKKLWCDFTCNRYTIALPCYVFPVLCNTTKYTLG